MSDFANLDDNQNIPFAGSTVPNNGLDLVNPDSVLSGQLRGTQNVGGSINGPQVDAAHNRFVIKNPADGSTIGMGSIPGSTTNEIGFFALNSQGVLIMKIVNGTQYVYDLTNNKNVMQTGKLPDGTYGWAVASAGHNVSEGF